jgi:serine/threonine protein kinase
MEMIGRYRILSLIGGGGMATVYKAEHPVLKQTVAIKVLHPRLAADPDFVARFQREAEAIVRLRHPNIVRWLDFDTDGDLCFMVLKYIDGPTLESRLDDLSGKGRCLSPTEVLTLLRPLVAALDYSHAQGFVHRDMKPANILLTSAGVCSII